MTASRNAVGLAVLVTVVLLLSSMGLIALASPAPGRAAPSPVSPTAVSSPGPAKASPSSEAASPGPAATKGGAAPSAPLPLPPTPESQQSGGTANSPLGSQVLKTLEAKGVPLHDIYLPDFLAAAHPGFTNGHVNLSYTSSPAPYGIGEFGLKNISGVITPYTLYTKSVEANFSTSYLSGYSAGISGPDEWGVQLNAVLNNVTLFGQGGYAFWTQNVFFYSPALQAVEFVSNIWNFSNPTGALSCNFLYQSDGYNVCPVYYYGVTSFIPTTEPFQLQLYLNSSLVGGRDAVYFNYSLTSGLGTTGGNYNYAIFNSLAAGGNPASTASPTFEANGAAYSPLGLPDDFEITLGGPGGGSNFDVFESISTYMSLQYWNTTSGGYTTVPSAYNVGGETGETSVGVNAAWTQFGSSGEFPARCVECVTLSNGPSFQYGLWGVGGTSAAGNVVPEIAWTGQAAMELAVDPPNSFVFVAQGNPFTGNWVTTDWSLFQWTPDFSPYVYYDNLPIGNYSVLVLLADHDATVTTFSLPTDTTYYRNTLVLLLEPTYGDWTPLWAFNESGVQNLSSGTDGAGNDVLYNGQYASMGEIPLTANSIADGAYFPFFGAFNDYGFPVFPGILMVGVSSFDVLSAPSLSVEAPPGANYQSAVNYFGWPETNDLQMLFWGDTDVNFEGSTVEGWWPAASDFGPSQSFASVVFWNTSSSVISGNTFSTGGMGLFLYGGYDNYLVNNTFITGAPPLSPNPAATVAEEYGSIGLVDVDWGDASYYGTDGYALCDYCDVITNNAFDTIITATSLFYDPYTGALPGLYPYDFSQAWNSAYVVGPTNIIGGHYVGGNYWWDYGYANNPYGRLPDAEFNFLPEYEFGANLAFIDDAYSGTGGDYYPLVNVAVHTITFEEQGLPAGTVWEVEMYIPPLYYYFQDDYAFNSSLAPSVVNLSETTGSWEYYPYSGNRNYAAVNGIVNITDANLVVTVVFQAAFELTVVETGLPSGTYWEAYAVNSGDQYYYAYGNTSQNNITELLPGTYTWFAYSEGSAYGEYANIPYRGTVTIASNTTVDVTFVPVFTLSVEALGLPAGAGWSFDASSGGGYNITRTSTGAWINITTAGTTFSWTAAASAYTASPGSGTLTLSANSTLTISFQESATLMFTETGLAAGTAWTVAINQSGVTTIVGGTGTSIAVNAVVGAFRFTVSAANYSATPASGSGTLPANATESVTFSAVTTPAPSSGSTGISTTAWVIIVVLAALAAIFLVTTILFSRRGRRPPPVAAYPAVQPAAGAPPSGSAPPWQETPPGPPSGPS